MSLGSLVSYNDPGVPPDKHGAIGCGLGIVIISIAFMLASAHCSMRFQ